MTTPSPRLHTPSAKPLPPPSNARAAKHPLELVHPGSGYVSPKQAFLVWLAYPGARLTSSVAGRMATAAFFAPEIETAPSSRCPPCTMYFTKSKALFDFIGSTGCNPEDLQCQRAAPE